MATCSCPIHSSINDGSRQLDNCSNACLVWEVPSLAQSHFPHNASSRHDINRMIQLYDKLLPIQTIVCQLLSFIWSSMVSWWFEIDIAGASPATSSRLDHKVSSISLSTWAAPCTKFSVHFEKHYFHAIIKIQNSDSDTCSWKWMIHWQHMS